jgi:hypothetical protein
MYAAGLVEGAAVKEIVSVVVVGAALRKGRCAIGAVAEIQFV